MNFIPAAMPQGGDDICREVGLDSEIKFNVLVLCGFHILDKSTSRASVFSSANRDNNIHFTAREQVRDLESKGHVPWIIL